ncbi:MAG: leucine-rich repeat domain-containing protein, partial [Microbacteriaceae bacterium]|nr:leucine-rich repeat domain-containing protein [Microbacteriaceae bacterium]
MHIFERLFLMSFFKKTAVAAIAGSLVFGALGVASANAAPITGGFVTQTTAEDPWAAPNAWQYFHIEKINGGAIIKGLNESGAQLARTHSIISIPATDKDGTTIIELTGRAGNGSAFGFSNHMSKVKGIKSWGKLKKISSVVTGLNIHVGGPVKLPDTWGEITEIGENAFIYSDIEKLPTSWGNVEKIAGGAFNGSSFAKQLVLPGDWGKVKEIGRHAFKEAGVASIPASWGMVETIGQGAFESNKLTAVPKDFANVRKIDSFAFEYNQITDFAQSWGKLTELDTRVFANNKIETLPKDFGNLTKFERSAFGVHKNLSSKSSLRFGDTYALPASNLTPKFINDVTAMILYSDKSAEGKQITLCTYDGSNPNTVPSSFLAKVNPAECAEFLKGIKKPEASNTEQPKTDAPNQDAPKGEQPKTDAPKTDAP